jgi:transcription termination factor NusB
MRLAELYGTAESPRFVHGVLDGLAHRAAPEKRGEDG